MKPRHPIAGLQRHAVTVPATEARVQLALVALGITAAALVVILGLIVVTK